MSSRVGSDHVLRLPNNQLTGRAGASHAGSMLKLLQACGLGCRIRGFECASRPMGFQRGNVQAAASLVERSLCALQSAITVKDHHKLANAGSQRIVEVCVPTSTFDLQFPSLLLRPSLFFLQLHPHFLWRSQTIFLTTGTGLPPILPNCSVHPLQGSQVRCLLVLKQEVPTYCAP